MAPWSRYFVCWRKILRRIKANTVSACAGRRRIFREDISLEARLFDGLIRGLSLRESSDELIAQGERKNAVKAAALRVKERLGE